MGHNAGVLPPQLQKVYLENQHMGSTESHHKSHFFNFPNDSYTLKK